MSYSYSPISTPLNETLAHGADETIAPLIDEIFESSSKAVQHTLLSQLVAKVYEVAAPHERKRMLEQLLMPMGVLSLVVVANGIFAKIWFRSGGQVASVRLEDAQMVDPSDVVALVNHVQQVSVDAVYGLTAMITASPVLTASASAALLLKILLRRAQSRRSTDA